MSDLIDRQAAIDALGEKPLAWTVGEYELGLQNQWQSDVDTLKALPSAQPERKTGKWIHHPEWEEDGECGYECSECHMGSDVDYNFCMRCGADMRGEQDE